MWLNWSVATINSMLQLLEIYRCGLVNCCVTKNRVQEFQKKKKKKGSSGVLFKRNYRFLFSRAYGESAL